MFNLIWKAQTKTQPQVRPVMAVNHAADEENADEESTNAYTSGIPSVGRSTRSRSPLVN